MTQNNINQKSFAMHISPGYTSSSRFPNEGDKPEMGLDSKMANMEIGNDKQRAVQSGAGVGTETMEIDMDWTEDVFVNPEKRGGPGEAMEDSDSVKPSASKKTNSGPTKLTNEVLKHCSRTEVTEPYERFEMNPTPKKFCHNVKNRRRYLAISKGIDILPDYKAMHMIREVRDQRRGNRRNIREFNNRPDRHLFRPWPLAPGA